MKKTTKSEILKKGKMSGFDYLYPQDLEIVNFVEKAFRKTAKLFGFEEIEGPMLQPIEFYQVKSGDELLKNTYQFKESEKETLVLRPELTPTVSYMIAKTAPNLSFPIRWWSNPVLFRKERPQKGRKRQFKQLNMDIFDRTDSGRERYFDEAEIIAASCFIFKSLGLSEKDIVIKISSRHLLEKLLEILDMKEKKQEIMHLLDKYGKISEEKFYGMIEKVLKSEEKTKVVKTWLDIKDIKEIKEKNELQVISNSREFQNLEKLFKILSLFQVEKFCEFGPEIVRGLGYYTGAVFEAFAKNGKINLRRAILGGGRYDNLTQAMGGQIAVTGVGFGMGNVPLIELIKERGLPKISQGIKYYVCLQNEKNRNEAGKITSYLRKRGESAIMDPSIAKETPESISKQLSRAGGLKAEYAVILFEKEAQKGKVVIKNLKNKTQKTVEIKKFNY